MLILKNTMINITKDESMNESTDIRFLRLGNRVDICVIFNLIWHPPKNINTKGSGWGLDTVANN
jgi:hypothetical protein